MWRRGSHLSDGAKALRLILGQPTWTFRRVESIAFLSSGESRRHVSWDFRVPEDLVIRAGPNRVAVPIATFAKRALRRLDVRDRSGGALSVWGREQNGELACELLSSGVRVLRRRDLTAVEAQSVRDIVFAVDRRRAAPALRELFRGLRTCGPRRRQRRDLIKTVRALAESLADGFLVVVELPEDAVGTRTLIKASFDDTRITRSRRALDRLRGRTTIDIEGRGWREAASWHLEVHAPDGLSIVKLKYDIWDDRTDHLRKSGLDELGGTDSTAHVTGRTVPPGHGSAAQVRFAPTSPGLLNQVTVGVIFALTVLLVANLQSGNIYDRLGDVGRAGPLAAVAFSLPAFLLALLSRGQEHLLVSRVLMAPRLVSFLSALCLWSAGVMMVWRPTEQSLATGFGVLAASQAVLLMWLGVIRTVGATR